MRQLKIRKPQGGGEPTLNQNDFSNMEAMQKFNNGQVYTKGFFADLPANQAFELPNLNLGGKARRLFGITLFVPNANITNDDIFSLTINQELIIDKVNWRAYSANQNNNPFKMEQYFAIPRALSGSDTVLAAFTATSAHRVWITFYLANSMR